MIVKTTAKQLDVTHLMPYNETTITSLSRAAQQQTLIKQISNCIRVYIKTIYQVPLEVHQIQHTQKYTIEVRKTINNEST